MAITHVVTTETSPWQSRSVATGGAAAVNLAVTGTRHQKLKGFGACFNELGYAGFMRASEGDRAKIMRDLISDDGCRFRFCRVPMGASDYALEWYSCNEHDGDLGMEKFSVERDEKYLIPYIREAQKVRGDIEFFASPWSPPTWMKTHRVCNHGTLRWEKPILEAYALYFRRFVEEYRKRGINVTQVHIQNEPMADQKFPSCQWKGEQMREFIADYIGPHFEKHKVPAEVWLGTINGPEDARIFWSRFDQWANLIFSCPKASRYAKGVGYQWAGKFALQQTAMAYPDVPIICSENECGNGTNYWLYAHYVWEMMQQYFVNNAVAYVYWNMVLATGGVSTWGWQQNSMITVDPATGAVKYEHEFYVMKHFSHFALPGAVRLGLKGPWTSNAVCFENPDGSVMLAIANPFGEARMLAADLGKARFEAELPASSFNTFVVRAG